jgi:hypothetical protein
MNKFLSSSLPLVTKRGAPRHYFPSALCKQQLIRLLSIDSKEPVGINVGADTGTSIANEVGRGARPGAGATDRTIDESRATQTKGATIAFFRSSSKSLSDRGRDSIWTKIKADIRAENVNVNDFRPPNNDPHKNRPPSDEIVKPKRKSRARPGPSTEDSGVDLKTFGSGAATDAGTGGRGRFGRDADMDDDEDGLAEDDGNANTDRIPPGVLAGLEDIDGLVETINTKDSILEMDDFNKGEKFLADLVYQCARSSDGIYRDIFTTREFPNVRIPQARPASTLLRSTVPDLNVPVESEGFEVGSTAWQVLSKNFYYTQADCKYIANMSAIHVNKLLAKAEANDDLYVDM